MAVKDYFKDLTAYVVSVGFFDKIKISASGKEISIEAMEKEKEIILKGSFISPSAELDGEFGLSNLSLLQTITNDPEYAFNESTLTVTNETKNAVTAPAELEYVNRSKSFVTYRFMSKNLVPDQPKFVEPKWDVVVSPTKANIQQLAWAANGLSVYEQYFTPKIVKGDLKFFIGDENAATQRGGVVFASERTETFESQHKWKVHQVLAALKAGETCDCKMAFSTKGAIQVTLDTGVGSYRYIFPAKAK